MRESDKKAPHALTNPIAATDILLPALSVGESLKTKETANP